MTKLETSPLALRFGVEIQGVDLADVAGDKFFPEIRAAFDRHSALLFRGQDLDAELHKRLALLFGPIEDRSQMDLKQSKDFEVPEVSNVTGDGGVTAEMDLHTLNLKANMLWHTDSTFLPVPALSNILTAKIVPSSGGNTELASTRAAWADMPESLKKQIRGRTVWHNQSHSRRRLSEELAALPMFNRWEPQHWQAIWKNPATGEEALYIASHAYRIEGMEAGESQMLIDELVEFCTQEQYIYSHKWSVGDVLIWDERSTLHRGTPWPYEEPRRLTSICSSATEADGLDQIRVTKAA